MTLAFRILYRFYRVNARLKGWIHRRFTHAGLGIIAATLIAAVMGVDTEHNLEYQAFAFLFCLVLLATVFALSFRGKFNAERVLPRFGTVGVPLVYTVTLRNRTSKTQSGLTLLERMGETFPTFPEWHAAQQVQQKGMRPFRVEQAHRSRPFRAATVTETPAPP